MPIEDLEFYSAAEAGRPERDVSLDDLSLKQVRQLATLVWRVLQVSGREGSAYFDEDNHLREGRIARLDGLAIVDGEVEGKRRIALYLIAEGDDAAIRMKDRRREFWFDTRGGGTPSDWLFDPVSPPDLWYNPVVDELARAADTPGEE